LSDGRQVVSAITFVSSTTRKTGFVEAGWNGQHGADGG
jgi:hypothetical protein